MNWQQYAIIGIIVLIVFSIGRWSADTNTQGKEIMQKNLQAKALCAERGMLYLATTIKSNGYGALCYTESPMKTYEFGV